MSALVVAVRASREVFGTLAGFALLLGFGLLARLGRLLVALCVALGADMVTVLASLFVVHGDATVSEHPRRV